MALSGNMLSTQTCPYVNADLDLPGCDCVDERLCLLQQSALGLIFTCLCRESRSGVEPVCAESHLSRLLTMEIGSFFPVFLQLWQCLVMHSLPVTNLLLLNHCLAVFYDTPACMVHAAYPRLDYRTISLHVAI